MVLLLRQALKDTSAWTEVSDTTIASTLVAISGLANSTEYEVQVRAKNAEGTGEWSDSGTGTTETSRGGGGGGPSANRSPVFIEGARTSRQVPENTTAATGMGDPIAATDADSNDTLTYTLSGTDGGSFAINGGNGRLMTKAALDYEAKSNYVVVVGVSDGRGGSDRTTVTIRVTNVDEVPELAGSASVMYEENGTDSVGAYSARDPEGAAIRWSLSGDDAGDFSISAAGVLRFSASPDFKGPTDADTDAEYEVAIQASDGSLTDAIAVTINVVNVDEPRSVTLSPTQPVVGEELPASLSDPDGSVSEVTWMWERSTDQNTWTDVSGAASAGYTPEAGDVGNYLRATATYADGEGPNKSARAVSENPVESLPQPEFITVPDAALVEPTEETVITSPEGEVALTFPANARDATFQVRMDTTLESCTVDEPPDGDVQLCVRVDLFDASGNREEDTILNEAATLEIWPESGVGRPAAILGVNKHSEG